MACKGNGGGQSSLQNNRETPCVTKKDETISNEFPNFAALTGDERLAFFEALSAARKNVERKGIEGRSGNIGYRGRRRLGTVHDEYLRLFEERFSRRENQPRGFAPGRDGSGVREHGEEASAASTLRGRDRDAGIRLLSVYETVLREDRDKIIDLYLKKRKMEVCEHEAWEIQRTMSNDGKRKRAGGEADVATPTPRFDALSSEEKAMFFRILKEARDSVHQKNPEREILPFETILRRYEPERDSVAVHHATTADGANVEKGVRKVHQNLKVRLMLTCVDNERLTRTGAERDRRRSQESSGREFQKNEEAPNLEKSKASAPRMYMNSNDQKTTKKNKATLKSRTKCERIKKKMKMGEGGADAETENEMAKVNVVKKEGKGDKNKKKKKKREEACVNPSDAQKLPEREESTFCIDGSQKSSDANPEKVFRAKVKTSERGRDEGETEESDKGNGEMQSARSAVADDKQEVKDLNGDRVGDISGAEASPEGQAAATGNLREEKARGPAEKDETGISDGPDTDDAIVCRGESKSMMKSPGKRDENEIGSECEETSEREESPEPDQKLTSGTGSVEKEPVESPIEEKRSSPKGLLEKVDAEAKSCCRVVVARSLLDTRYMEKFRGEDRQVPSTAAKVRESLTSPQIFVDLEEGTKSKPKGSAVAASRDELPEKVSEPEKDIEGASGAKASSTALSSTGTGSVALDGEKGDAKAMGSEVDEGKEEAEKYEEDDENEEYEEDSLLVPMFVKKKALPTTKIRILQDLLKERAAFVEGSIGEFKIVTLPPKEGGITETPTAHLRVDEDEETRSERGIKSRFVKVLANLCRCGKKDVAEEDDILENLKGEAVAVDVSKGTRTPASVTLNESTVEVLKAAQRKKIIQKYWKTT